jgi:hypothetical protein
VGVVIALTLLVAGALWFVRRDVSHVERVTSETHATRDLELADSAARLESPEITAAASAAQTGENPASTDIALRSPLAERALAVALGPVLKVVGRTDLDAVPRATVYWFEEGNIGSATALLALGPESEAGPWPPGTRRFVTDETGCVQLPSARGPAYVVGFAARRSGAYEIPAGWRSKAYLRLDAALYARVVTDTGVPAFDIPVEAVDLSRRSSTDSHGRVRLVLRTHKEKELSSEQLTLRAHVTELYHVDLDVPADAEADRRWTLALPTTGAMRICVTDAASLLGVVRGVVNVNDAALMAERDLSQRVRAERTVRFTDSCALVERVPIGRSYRVVVSCERLAFRAAWTLPGPAVRDDEIVHEVRVGELPIGVVRVLDASGNPLRESHVSVQLEAPDQWQADGVSTDADGRVHVLLFAPYTAGSRRVLEFASNDKERASFDLSRALPNGVTDLGDVRLGPAEAEHTDAKPFNGRKLGGAK